MAGACEPHPTDEGKFQHTHSEYGHGEGSGKSRSAVFKHHKKWSLAHDAHDAPEPAPTHEEVDSVQDAEVVESRVTSDDEDDAEFVQDVSETLGNIEWADKDEREPKARTIPKPLSDVARGRQSVVTREATRSMLRYAYVALDRLVSHWGRGVMSRPSYTIERSSDDYDALQDSTVAVLDHYGVEVPMSPLLVWGATVGAAYGPPVAHIRRNADPNRVKGGFSLKSAWSKFRGLFKRKPKRTATGRSTLEVSSRDSEPQP